MASPLDGTLHVRGTVRVRNNGAVAASPAAAFSVDNTSGTSAAVKGEINSQLATFGTAAIFGVSSGTGGYAGLFHAQNPAGNGAALVAVSDGNGNGIRAAAEKAGNGVESSIDGEGRAIYGWASTFSTGRAAEFAVFNTDSFSPAVRVRMMGRGSGLVVEHQGTSGNIAIFKNGSPGTVNVARIDKDGKGFFNGGTQVGGADVAELVPTSGHAPEPGDVVEIDPEAPDRFRLSTEPKSTRVAGVISTDPGVTMNARTGAEKDVTGPALALVGRVPVKATTENGPIRIGDLLVTAKTRGRAMRAPADPAPGTVLGKALQAANHNGTIQMLVMLR